jgi:small subunit ribosomal protein S8
MRPSSKLLMGVLEILKRSGYIASYEEKKDGRGNELVVSGIGPINDCGVIKPRFAVHADEWIKWEERFVLSKDFGILIVSTSQGLMTNTEARSKSLGGRLIAYVY